MAARSLSLGSAVFGSLVAALPVAAPVVPPSARLLRASVRAARAVYQSALLGAAIPAGFVASLRRDWAVCKSLGAPAARLAVLTRAARLVVSLEAASSFAGSGFVPASLSLGRAGVVASSRFLEVASGVVLPFGSVRVDDYAVWVVAPKFTGRCLWSGLGGQKSADAAALLTALRSCEGTGLGCTFLGAPGVSGRVASGYFCGVMSA